MANNIQPFNPPALKRPTPSDVNPMSYNYSQNPFNSPAKVGAKATAPIVNKTPNTLPPQMNTNTQTDIRNPALLSRLADQGDLQKDTGYQGLLRQLGNVNRQQPVASLNIMNDTTRGIPESVMDARTAQTNSLYNQLASNKQAEISNYLTAKGQSIGALTSAVGSSQPTQVSPGNFYVNPQTGQDITGGSIDPFSGGQRQARVSLGGEYERGKSDLASTNSLSNSLKGMIQSSGLNSNQLAASNFLNQVLARNFSDPKLGPINAQLSNVITQYSSILGVDPNTLITNLTATSQGQTIEELLNNLAYQAQVKNEGKRDPASVASIQAPAPVQSKIRVQIGNQTGTIDASEFDPRTMQKI